MLVSSFNLSQSFNYAPYLVCKKWFKSEISCFCIRIWINAKGHFGCNCEGRGSRAAGGVARLSGKHDPLLCQHCGQGRGTYSSAQQLILSFINTASTDWIYTLVVFLKCALVTFHLWKVSVLALEDFFFWFLKQSKRGI
jgi:hypothetical protein